MYRLTRTLPREEVFGLTSQLRRVSLSVPLNIIEGFARQTLKVQVQFLQIAYGSLKEAQYLLVFSTEENYLSDDEVKAVYEQGDEVVRLPWGRIKKLEKEKHEASGLISLLSAIC